MNATETVDAAWVPPTPAPDAVSDFWRRYAPAKAITAAWNRARDACYEDDRLLELYGESGVPLPVVLTDAAGPWSTVPFQDRVFVLQGAIVEYLDELVGVVDRWCPRYLYRGEVFHGVQMALGRAMVERFKSGYAASWAKLSDFDARQLRKADYLGSVMLGWVGRLKYRNKPVAVKLVGCVLPALIG